MSQVLKPCPQCGLALQPNVTDCPRCAHFYRTQPAAILQRSIDPNAMTPAKWFMFSGAVLFMVFFIFVLQPSWNQTGQASADINKVKFGMTIPDVKAIMGEPDQNQDMQSTGMRMQCFYYTANGHQVQVVFQNGYVESINRY